MVVDRIECNLDKPGSNTYDTHFAWIHASLQGPNLMDFSMYEAAHRFYAPNPGRWGVAHTCR